MTEQRLKLDLEFRETQESDPFTRQEFDEEVHVAVRMEVAACA